MSESLTPTQIRDAIEAAKSAYESTGDARHADRVAWGTVDMSVAARPLVSLRRATMDDATYLYDVRMDPLTRQMSRQTGAIPWPHHLEWLERTLANPRETLFVAMLYTCSPIGTGRLSRGDHDIELSMSVEPRWRGLGYGQKIVRELVQAAKDMGLPLVAEILTTNAPSLLAFVREGFVPAEIMDDRHIVADWTPATPARRWVWMRKGI